MRLAFILFDQMTSLDLIGFYDPVTRLQSMGFMPELQYHFCARSEEIRDDRGLVYRVDQGNNDLSGYDMLFVPGGMGTRSLMHDEAFIDWLKTAQPVPYKVSVCTGSLLLGAAGRIPRFARSANGELHGTIFYYKWLE